jgi:hypothetical protein
MASPRVERARWQRDLAGAMHERGHTRAEIDWDRAEALRLAGKSPAEAASELLAPSPAPPAPSAVPSAEAPLPTTDAPDAPDEDY